MSDRAQLGFSSIHTVWDRSLPASLEVDSGAVIEFDVRDSSNGQITVSSTAEDIAALDFTRVNPVTGPVFVRGARPGDVLSVEILEFVPSSWGWTGIIPGFGLLADEFPEPWLGISEIDVLARRVWFSDSVSVPLASFPGTIGVAPAEHGRFSMVPPTRWGGNLDVKHLQQGTTLLLPVAVEGALFSLGDTHAAQGDGEVCGTAVEFGAGVAVRISVIRDRELSAPRIVVPVGSEYPRPTLGTTHLCTGVAPDLMDAARAATRSAIDLLMDGHCESREEAYALLSIAGDLRIHEVVDSPNWVVGMSVSDSVFLKGA